MLGSPRISHRDACKRLGVRSSESAVTPVDEKGGIEWVDKGEGDGVMGVERGWRETRGGECCVRMVRVRVCTSCYVCMGSHVE